MSKLSSSPSKSQVTNPSLVNYFYKSGAKLQENGYSILCVAPGEKYPATFERRKDGTTWKPQFNWQDATPDPEIFKEVGPTSIGIKTGLLEGQSQGVIAVDIDLLDFDLVLLARRTAFDMLGETPLVRQGQAPKELLVYRTENAFPKVRMGKIEILSNGQQFLSHGRHPSGVDYQWIGGSSPDDTSVSELPLVTLEKIEAYLKAVRELLPKEHQDSIKTNIESRHDLLDGDRVRGSIEALTAAMQCVPADSGKGDYTGWNRWGMMIFAATGGSSEGQRLFDEWSQKSSAYDAKSVTTKWHQLRASPPTHISGAAGIYAEATQNGWKGEHIYPSKAHFLPLIEAYKDRGIFGPRLDAAPAATSGLAVAPTPAVSNVVTMPGIAANDDSQQSVPQLNEAPAALEPSQPTPHTTSIPCPPAQPTPLAKLGRGCSYLLDEPLPYRQKPELIRDLVPHPTIGFLGGQSGAGKTFVAIEFAMCVMTGADFVGHKVEKSGGVIIVAAEGEHTLEDRIAARRTLLPNPNMKLPLAVVSGVTPILS